MTREQKGKALYERWIVALAKIYKFHKTGREWEDLHPKEKEVWILTAEEDEPREQ
jgi:hypothetical protein